MDRKKIGDLIKERRLKRNFSQKKLADLCTPKISFKRIGEVESGSSNYTIETLESILTPLGLSLSVIFTGYPTKTNTTTKPKSFDFSKINSNLDEK